jgi:hypothetical protein
LNQKLPSALCLKFSREKTKSGGKPPFPTETGLS